MTISMPVEPDANDLLSRDPLALLIAMLLDQQVPLERPSARPMTWPGGWGTSRAPRNWPTTTRARSPPCSPNGRAAPLPESMAARVQALGRLIADRYDGDAGRVWGDVADGADLRKRVGELPDSGRRSPDLRGPLGTVACGRCVRRRRGVR